jgi:putative two-component system response regulator
MAKALSADYGVLRASTPAPRSEGVRRSAPGPDPARRRDAGRERLRGRQALKAEAATADIPVIFLTGKSEAQAQVGGFQLGAVDYVASRSTPAC